MKALATIAALGCALTATVAQAGYSNSHNGQRVWPNWYVGVQGALPFVSETDVEINNASAGDVDFESGYGVGFSLGYNPGPTNTFLDNTRFELEYFIRNNELDEYNVGGISTQIADDVSSNSYMANLYYDIPLTPRFAPYIGAGVGISEVELSVPTLSLDDTDSVFTYQLMAGVGWQPESLLNTVLQFGYRFLDTSDPEFTGATGTRFSHEYQVHSIEAGARFRF